MSDREAELTRKLADRFHLGVAERAERPGGKVRWSMLVAVVGERLADSGWFPKDWRPATHHARRHEQRLMSGR